MEHNNILQQLQAIAKSNGCDTIKKVAMLNNKPVFVLRNSKRPLRGKVGYPFLWSVRLSGSVYELDVDEIHEVIVSWKSHKNGL